MKIKIFLSSTTRELADARLTIPEELTKKLGNNFELVTFESHKKHYPNLPPEETCMQLVRDSSALLLLLDQYYGTSSKQNNAISIIHAEVLEAKKITLPIIPVVRKRTWDEYFIWKGNPGVEIKYSYVLEPKLFEIIDLLYNDFNFHTFDSFTSSESLNEIATTFKAVSTSKASGTADHLALQGKETFEQKRETTEKIRRFLPGDVLSSSGLNSLSIRIAEVSVSKGLPPPSITLLTPGTILMAEDLNKMLEFINRVYAHLGKPKPVWSFGKFESRKVLKAEQLNEIIVKLENIEI